MTNVTTFKVADVDVPHLERVEHLIKEPLKLKNVIEKKYKGVEACACNTEKPLIRANGNPFVDTAMLAYDLHLPIVISPDDVWLCLANGLAAHINQNAEELRSQFVDFEGKKYIEIQRNGFVKGSSTNDWQGCFVEFSEQIATFIGEKRDLIVSNFSTTGPVERAASEVILMDAMQMYFEYGCRTCSGFPEITVLGTVEDWKGIRARVSAMEEFGLEWWIPHLRPCIDQFVALKERAHVDLEFWKSFLMLGGGSGGPYITGWINTLFPYLSNRRSGFYKNTHIQGKTSRWEGATSDTYPDGLGKAPVQWHYYAETFNMEFMGGHVAMSLDPESLEARVVTGWAIREATK